MGLRIFVLSTASDHSDSQPQLGNTELDAHSNPFQLWNFVIFLLFYKWPTKIERKKKKEVNVSASRALFWEGMLEWKGWEFLERMKFGLESHGQCWVSSSPSPEWLRPEVDCLSNSGLVFNSGCELDWLWKLSQPTCLHFYSFLFRKTANYHLCPCLTSKATQCNCFLPLKEKGSIQKRPSLDRDI